MQLLGEVNIPSQSRTQPGSARTRSPVQQGCNTESSQPHPSGPTGPGEEIHAKEQSWHEENRGKWA